MSGTPDTGQQAGGPGCPPAARRGRRRALVVVGLLALVGLGGYAGGGALWAEHQLRAAATAAEKGDFAAAEDCLRRCLRVRPSSAPAHLLLARAARRAGDYRQAEESLEACQRLGGRSEAVTLEHALLRAQRGDVTPEQEAWLLGTVGPDNPDRPLVLEALAAGAALTSNWPRAMDRLNELLERWPDSYPGRLLRGRVWESINQEDEALEDYQRAAEINPEMTEARLGLARGLYRAGRVREAAWHYRRVRDGRPDDPEVLLGLARCAYDANELDEAGRLLDALLAGRPDHFAALLERGRLAFRRGDAAGAEAWVRRALDVRPPDREGPSFQAIVERCDAYRLLSLFLEAQGKSDRAAESLALMDRVQADLRRATELSEELRAAPADASRHCELGIIFLRLGREDQGLHALATALRYDPHHEGARAAQAEYRRTHAPPEVRP
jgi:tetratricopeptide (TPR) repeat protein